MSALLDLLSGDDWSDITADLAVGGEAWTVEHKTGAGVMGPTGSSAGAPITGTVYRAKPPTIVVSQAQTPVAAKVWHLNLRTGTVVIGDVIQSQDDPTYRFTVKSLPDQDGEPVLLERSR